MIFQASPIQAEWYFRHHNSRQNDITGITNPGRMILQPSPLQAEWYYRHHHPRQNDLPGLTSPGRMISQASPSQAKLYYRLHHSRQNDITGITIPGRMIFHKTTQAWQCLLIVLMTSIRTYLPSINTLACSKAEILSLYLEIWTSHSLRRITQAWQDQNNSFIDVRSTILLTLHTFLACTKSELCYLTVCISVNEGKIQNRAVSLTFVQQCPISNLSEIFSYTTCSNFMFLDYFLSYHAQNTHAHAHTHTHTHTQTLTSTLVLFCKNATVITFLWQYMSKGSYNCEVNFHHAS